MNFLNTKVAVTSYLLTAFSLVIEVTLTLRAGGWNGGRINRIYSGNVMGIDGPIISKLRVGCGRVPGGRAGIWNIRGVSTLGAQSRTRCYQWNRPWRHSLTKGIK